jgi:putative transposase
MARMARLVVAGYPHHITQRGNRRQTTFFCPEDYQHYIGLMAHFCCEAETEVLAYCLMPNHVHFVMVPSHKDGLRASVGEAHRRYTRRINFRQGWRGHLWQERFHSFLMDENYLLSAVRYVENNPVKANLCVKAEDWEWSSARAHIEGMDDILVRVKPMLDRIDNWTSYLSKDNTTQEIDETLSKHTRTGRPLGDESFIRQIEVITGLPLMPQKPGPKV